MKVVRVFFNTGKVQVWWRVLDVDVGPYNLKFRAEVENEGVEVTFDRSVIAGWEVRNTK